MCGGRMRRRCLEPEVERADAAGFDLGRDSIDPFPTSSQVLTYSNRCGLLSSDRPGSMQSGVSYFTLPTLGRPSRPSCSRQGRVAGDGASLRISRSEPEVIVLALKDDRNSVVQRLDPIRLGSVVMTVTRGISGLYVAQTCAFRNCDAMRSTVRRVWRVGPGNTGGASRRGITERQEALATDQPLAAFADPPPAQSSRSRTIGSTESARCAGIHVAARPNEAMARTTPANTKWIAGVA
jgi:hypothetical protein